MPTGVPRSNYIPELTTALGWGARQRTRDTLKDKAGIFPYAGREKEAIEYFINSGHDLRNYQAKSPETQALIEHTYGKVSHRTSLVVQQQQPLALTPESETPSVSKPVPRLINRIAKLMTGCKDDASAKALARKVLTNGGYRKPKNGTWVDETKALKILQDAGYSTDGFEYLSSASTTATGSDVTHLPANVQNMPPQALKLEIARLQQQIADLTLRARLAEGRMGSFITTLDQVVNSAYDEVDKRRKIDPHARLSNAELEADWLHRRATEK